MPSFSPRTEWIAGKGAAAWEIHFRAWKESETDPDVIVMSVGDPDFSTPDHIVKTAVDALHGGDTHYAEVKGRLPLRKAIARDMNAKARNVSAAPLYNADNIAVLAGTQNALFTAAQLLLAPGDEVIALDPMYVTYEAFLRASGADLVRVPCDAENGFRPDIKAIEKAITPRTKAIAFSNPNNPTGVVLNRAELDAIAAVANQHDLWVIADEVYAGLTFEEPHLPFAALPQMAERTATVSSLSKSHAMTGWRAGWLAGPVEMANHAANLALCMLYGLPGFIQEAATQALENGGDDVAEMCAIYRARRDLVAKELAELERINVLLPEAGMFVLLDVRETGLSARDFAIGLYEAEKVSLLDGGAFGENAAGFARLSFTGADDQLREGCARINRYAASLPT